MNNINLRLNSEDEEAEYRSQKAIERYEKQQAKKQSLNDSKHVLDPDREWGNEE